MPAWWNKKGWSKDSDNSASKRGKIIDNHKVNCFDVAHTRNSPSISRDCSAGDSSGFDKGHPHPLPRPLIDQLHGGGSGSGSVSSVSSSGSSDDHAQIAADQPAFRLVSSLFGAFFGLIIWDFLVNGSSV